MHVAEGTVSEGGGDRLIAGPVPGSTTDDQPQKLGVSSEPLSEPKENETFDLLERPEQRAAIGRSDIDRAPAGDGAEVDTWVGSPPLVASLIEGGHERLAYLMSLNTADEGRASVLYSFCSAFGLRPDVAQVHLTEIVAAAEAPESIGREEARVLLSAGIRLALGLGYMPIPLEPLREKADLDGHSTNGLVTHAIKLAMHGYKRPGPLVPEQDLPAQWLAVAGQADQVLNDLRNARVSFHRATKIAHYVARNNQPVGEALIALMNIAHAHGQGETAGDPRWKPIETLAHQLRNDNGIDRLINETYRSVSSPQQALKPIVAGARDNLLSLLRAVVEVVQVGLELRQRADGLGNAHSVGVNEFAATRAQFEPFEPTSVGEAALHRLGEWVTGDGREQFSGASLADLINEQLSPLFELPRDGDGRPTRNPTDAELLLLTESRPLGEVIDGYLTAGNVKAAEDLLASQSPVATEIEESLQKARREHERNRRQLLAHAESLISRLRTLEDDDRARELATRLERSRLMEPGRFDLARSPLEALARDAAENLARKRYSCIRAKSLHSAAETERIVGLIGPAEVLAGEYLALSESGQELPVFVPPSKDDLATSSHTWLTSPPLVTPRGRSRTLSAWAKVPEPSVTPVASRGTGSMVETVVAEAGRWRWGNYVLGCPDLAATRFHSRHQQLVPRDHAAKARWLRSLGHQGTTPGTRLRPLLRHPGQRHLRHHGGVGRVDAATAPRPHGR